MFDLRPHPSLQFVVQRLNDKAGQAYQDQKHGNLVIMGPQGNPGMQDEGNEFKHHQQEKGA
jgi:hypothetical protein